MALWTSKLNDQTPDEVAGMIFAPHLSGSTTPPTNAHCTVVQTRDDALRPVPIFRITSHIEMIGKVGCAQIEPGDPVDPTDDRIIPLPGCTKWPPSTDSEYWNPPVANVYVYDRGFVDVVTSRSYLLHVITHELGHVWGHFGHPECDTSNPVLSIMDGSISSDAPCSASYNKTVPIEVQAVDVAAFNRIYDLAAPELHSCLPFLQLRDSEVLINFDALHIRNEQHILIESTETENDWSSPEEGASLLPPDTEKGAFVDF